ncbi:toprim domain-containing protein [Candidatus Pacearchaeota archaeon]|jgi:DNA gyrase/topoisomerase IV subunit B|nr:toprim domain-containing protein [bacterium]MCK9597235.1 toprim domain-containing protein [Candidatus Pacearchaeota archaeon]
MSYNKDSIKILEKLEPIRVRPDLFIGDTSNPNHLIYEVIDNSMDELINDNGTCLGVFVDTNRKFYTVLDDGRGMPIDQIKGEDIPILLSTIPFSGGKFEKQAYKISSGLHGVGLSAVNALSDYMEIEIYKIQEEVYGKKMAHVTYNFKDGLLVDKKVELLPKKIDKPFSTRVSFIPSSKYFSDLNINAEMIERRLGVCSIFSGKKMILNIDGVEKIIKEDLKTHFLKNYASDPLFDPIEIKFKSGNQEIELIFTYEKGNEPAKTYSSVNLIPVNLGSHITIVENIIADILFSKKGNKNILRRDCLVSLKCYFNIYLEETKFASQTKERLTTPKEKIIEIVNDNFKNCIIKELDKRKLFSVLLDKFETYRIKLESKQSVKNLSGNAGIRGIIDKDSKLVDCQYFKDSELIIIEGDSAGTTCIDARDNKKHAILPLKGKVMNISSKKQLDSILKNKELYDIIRSIGVGFKSKTTDVNMKNLRYSKIILCPDPDPDGEHIAVLLMNFFMIMLPEIIEKGILYVAEIPLYGLVTKDNFIPCWTKEEMDALMEKNPTASKRRFKGLGEFNDDQLKPCLFDEKTRRLYKVKQVDEKTRTELVNLLIDPSYKRMLLSGEFENKIKDIKEG